MAFNGLAQFVRELEKRHELVRINQFVDPILGITEITDRIVKTGGKALLFENNGTPFPVLVNSYGSDERMAYAIGRTDLDDAGKEIFNIFGNISGAGENLMKKLSSLPSLIKLAGYMPARKPGRGRCQDVVIKDPDLSVLPVLKCWPHDGGRYITLPVVHTKHPDTGKTNAGMYRMQILGRNTTAMHWQRHKTGANHFEAWKQSGKKMAVTVTLGGDPVYAYSATAPLPEGIDEYILAGFLRKKRVKMVRCLTNDLYVPEDADIVLEGYVDPSEELFMEGPFGDHTGFYSLADLYPVFHVTCLTYRSGAVYPATIVGIPPHEDAWIARATEKIFLSPVRMAIQPEVEDFHMPEAGIAHNLVIVKIRKSYPGQGMKVISSLSGAGQMMFSKYIIAVSGDVDIRNYRELALHIFANTEMTRDLLFSSGPLDVLDHASDAFSVGGKMGIDATIKLPEELSGSEHDAGQLAEKVSSDEVLKSNGSPFIAINSSLSLIGIPVAIVSVSNTEANNPPDSLADFFRRNGFKSFFRLIILVDDTVDIEDLHMVAWQLLGNSDPKRDHLYISPGCLLIDGRIKVYRKGGFPRKWPNVVCSEPETIDHIDKIWNSLDIGAFIDSPSRKYGRLIRKGNDEIIV